MSGYGEGWRLIQNPEVARETELAREREVRARFEGRIEERRITKTRLERAAAEATRRSNAFICRCVSPIIKVLMIVHR